MKLEELGLTDYESRVFESLVKSGKSSASQISRESGVSYGRIYEVLASLEAKGLVKVVPEETKKFVISDIDHLIKIVEKRQKELDALKKDIVKLKEVYKESPETLTVVRGKKNFYKIFRELQKVDTKFVYTIKYSLDMNPSIMRQEKQNITKWKIDAKTLLPLNDSTKVGLEKWLKIHKNFKIIENEGVAMSIMQDIVMISLIKANSIVLIKNKEFSNIMKQLFQKTYEQSADVKDLITK